MASVPPGSKRCTGPCKRILPLSSFSSNRSKPDGLQERCKDCNRADRARRRQAARDLNEALTDPKVLRRYWSKVDQRASDICWPWTAGTKSNESQQRYGIFSIDGYTYLAPRIAFTIAYGRIPEGMLVCHSCDNPSCVNPAHLWLGTPGDNMGDCSRKGRIAFPHHLRLCQPSDEQRPHGSRHPITPFTDADILAIREAARSGMRHSALARTYGVSQTAIAAIVRGKVWRHLPV